MRKQERQDERVSMYLRINTFELGTDKEAALKPLEEAAEIFGAWQTVQEQESGREFVMNAYGVSLDVLGVHDFALEIADCITACCNLAARYDLDLESALKEVEQRNKERGRYGTYLS